MFGIGETELVIIVLFAFMVFGPDKLPGMGRTIGRALRQFREAQQGFTQVVQTEVLDPAAEAMNVTPTRRTRNRAAELEADSDIEDGAEGTTVRRKETFAERKARLEAERKAAAEAAEAEAAAAAAAAEEAAAEDAEDSDADADAETAVEAAPVEAVAEPEPEAEEPSANDALASLYGISAKTTKSARKQANEDKAAEIAARKAAAEAAKAAAAEADEAADEDAGVDEDVAEPEAAPAADADDTGKEDGTPEA